MEGRNSLDAHQICAPLGRWTTGVHSGRLSGIGDGGGMATHAGVRLTNVLLKSYLSSAFLLCVWTHGSE